MLGTTSKYLGKTYEGFTVIRYFVRNNYAKIYGNPKQKVHPAYSYELFNSTTHQHLTISGNQLRLLENGSRTISQMLDYSNKGGMKNPQIRDYKKWLRSKQ